MIFSINSIYDETLPHTRLTKKNKKRLPNTGKN